jgi:ketosteroid isomerase-like protein
MEGTRRIHWEPFSATLSDSGDMGFTLGSYQIVSRADGGSAGAGVSSGKYVTLWRHEPSGAWDVVFDSGVPDTAAK